MSRVRTVLEVHLKRRGMGPASADVKEVGAILLAIADAVRGALGGSVEGAEPDEPLLSLVKIEKGNSLDLAFATRYPDAVRRAIGEVVEAYQNPGAANHPSWARASGKRLVETAKLLQCQMEVRTLGRDRDRKIAVIKESTVFAEPPKVRGTTVLWGEVIRVGGRKDPSVAIDTGPPDGVVPCHATREAARDLAHRLYERVAVEGVETRTFPALGLQEFTIVRVLPWRPNGIEASLEELGSVLGKAWAGVEDIEAAVREFRSGDDD